MVLSYSAIAQPKPDTPKIINISGQPTTSAASNQNEAPASSSSTSDPNPNLAAQPESVAGPSNHSQPRIKHLILDAGPLLSLTPLRHLASHFYTTPAVIQELRDPKAREYYQNLGLSGVDVKVVQPGGEAMARVMAFARKTGDYAVLSTTDLGVIALTLQCHLRENGGEGLRLEPGVKNSPVPDKAVDAGSEADNASTDQSGDKDVGEERQTETLEGAAVELGSDTGDSEASDSVGGEGEDAEEGEGQRQEEVRGTVLEEQVEGDMSTSSRPPTNNTAVQMNDLTISEPPSFATSHTTPQPPPPSTDADPESDSDSDAGEWITPSNVSKHRSRDLGYLPEGGQNTSKEIVAACMTGDFAVQNVLLAMGLGLVGEGGKRINKVKSWVLRCHACFKICKDSSKKFCPSCGNPTLLRTSTTTTSNGKTHLHLKRNYQYNLRGSKFTIPDAKPGRAKGQLKGGTGLILREDQREWTDAVRKEDIRKGKEEKKMLKGWDDPDWMPEIITVGMSGKGRSGAHGLPTIGHGRKNPNIAKKKR